jgi:pimeloyl-ACP methyl ester carboxylesterase
MRFVSLLVTVLTLSTWAFAQGAHGASADSPELPSWQLLLGEAQAALAAKPKEIPPDLLEARPGDGRPVLVMPAFFAADWQTEPLRAFLAKKGYAAYGWELGPNLGPTAAILYGMERRLDEIRAEHGGAKVTLIGHSLGGVLARELAKKHPDAVRQLIVLTSPIHAPTASLLVPIYELLSRWYSADAEALEAKLNEPPTVPVTAIYTRTDGIIAWESALEAPGPRRENVEVAGAHVTMARNFDAWRVILDRLRLGEGAWRPYRGQGAPEMQRAAVRVR